MLRDVNKVKEKVEEFFASKEPGISVRFSGEQPLTINVDIYRGDDSGQIHIRNSFYSKTGGWKHLKDKLEDYWSNSFPNDRILTIIPWDSNTDL
jgi:hypothetical protein